MFTSHDHRDEREQCISGVKVSSAPRVLRAGIQLDIVYTVMWTVDPASHLLRVEDMPFSLRYVDVRGFVGFG